VNHRKGPRKPPRSGRQVTDPPVIARLRHAGALWLVAAGCMTVSAAALGVSLAVTPWQGWADVPAALVLVADAALIVAAVVQYATNKRHASDLRRMRYRPATATSQFPAVDS
jgi:hypothetical protein